MKIKNKKRRISWSIYQKAQLETAEDLRKISTSNCQNNTDMPSTSTSNVSFDETPSSENQQENDSDSYSIENIFSNLSSSDEDLEETYPIIQSTHNNNFERINTESLDEQNLTSKIANWAVTHKISHLALNDLLHILNP